MPVAGCQRARKIKQAAKISAKNDSVEVYVLNHWPPNREWIIILLSPDDNSCSDDYGYSEIIFSFLVYLPSLTVVTSHSAVLYSTNRSINYLTEYSISKGLFLSWQSRDNVDGKDVDGKNVNSKNVNDNRIIIQWSYEQKIFDFPYSMLYYQTLANSINITLSLQLTTQTFPQLTTQTFPQLTTQTFPKDLALIILQYLYVNYIPVDIEMICIGLSLSFNIGEIDTHNEGVYYIDDKIEKEFIKKLNKRH